MARLKTVLGYTVEQYTSPNTGGAMDDHRGVVMHIAEGTYRGTISWQMNPDQRYANGTSVTSCSTFTIGRNEGEIAQMCDSGTIAWCQRSGSRTWLSIELAGYAPNPPTDWQIRASAEVLKWSAGLYGHPIARADNPSERGLGHHSMDREWLGEEWGHDACPGAGVLAAKDRIVALAQGEDDMTPEEMLNAPLYNPITQANAKYGAFIQSINSSAYWALQEAKKARLASEAAVAAVKGVDTAGIMARINEFAAAEQQRDAELVDRIVAALPAGNDPVSRDELEAALRSVLGSVDNAPATQ